MKIRLLGSGRDFKSSPERSVYSIAKNSSNRYQLVVPIDVWFLENVPSSSELYKGKLRKLPSSWNGLELGVPGNTSGVGTLLGEPPNISVGDFTPAISCLANSDFMLFSNEQKAVEKATRLSVFPEEEVVLGETKAAIGSTPGEVIRTNVDFFPPFLLSLNLAIAPIKVYQLRMSGQIGYNMIGTPVITEAFRAPVGRESLLGANPARRFKLERLGMLIGVNNNQSNGECIASVVPGKLLEELF